MPGLSFPARYISSSSSSHNQEVNVPLPPFHPPMNRFLDQLLHANHFQLPAEAAFQGPLVPSNRHKACKPSAAQIEWLLKSKEELQVRCTGRQLKVGCDRVDADGDEDLADMVHDFMENASSDRAKDRCEENDSDAPAPGLPSASDRERLKAVIASMASVEKEIVSIITTVFLAVNEFDLFCSDNGFDCHGNCIRRLAVKHLKTSGYNASICRSKWQQFGKMPGGEYEYIDACFERDPSLKDRIYIDLDFRSQFEIARPSQSYQAAVRSLPLVFVGKSSKLEQILQIMSEAARCSLKQSSMHLPPWRTLAYMRAKWLSPYEKKGVELRDEQRQHLHAINSKNYYEAEPGFIGSSQSCREHLSRLKAALKVDAREGIVLKPILNGRGNRRGTW